METTNFNTLYTNYYKKAFLFTKSYVHNELEAEDIVVEALLVLWNTLKAGNGEHLQTYLFTILRNKSLDYLKRQIIKQQVIAQLSSVAQRDLEIRISSLQACEPTEILLEELQQIVDNALTTLPHQTSLIFRLSRFEHKSNIEIAEQLGITSKGVEYHITKSLNFLRIVLKDYLPFFIFFLL